MKMLERELLKSLDRKTIPGKVLMILGARRVGKTELLNSYMNSFSADSYLKLNGEDIRDADLLKERSVQNYSRILGEKKLLVIDEAQKIPASGLILKLITDSFKDVKVIVTGSSVFDLSNKLGEPLVGRKNTLYLYPFAQMELSKHENYSETIANLESRMIFGNYPELIQYKTDKEKSDYLQELVNSYLLKDILSFEGVKNSDKILDLLRLIAFQTGKEVSVQELGSNLTLSKNTVERYLDLLSKVFIIYKLRGFSRNLRKEITKMNRWYFFDTGIRNAIIGNFNRLKLRNDSGELWENYIISERIKFQNYKEMHVRNYFWRTYTQQEIDWVEEENGKLKAYEIKFRSGKKVKIPSLWAKTYPDSEFNVIDGRNFTDWILP